MDAKQPANSRDSQKSTVRRVTIVESQSEPTGNYFQVRTIKLSQSAKKALSTGVSRRELSGG